MSALPYRRRQFHHDRRDLARAQGVMVAAAVEWFDAWIVRKNYQAAAVRLEEATQEVRRLTRRTVKARKRMEKAR